MSPVTTFRTGPALQLVVQTPTHWREARDLRLQMLGDSPLAYLETLETARARSDQEWERRHSSHFTPTSRKVALTDPAGSWRGQMAVEVFDARATLLAVWLHPDSRGKGGAELMLADIVVHVRDRLGLDELVLEVHEHNLRAIAFYRQCGFVRTGARRPYPLDETNDELEMRLDLG